METSFPQPANVGQERTRISFPTKRNGYGWGSDATLVKLAVAVLILHATVIALHCINSALHLPVLLVSQLRKGTHHSRHQPGPVCSPRSDKGGNRSKVALGAANSAQGRPLVRGGPMSSGDVAWRRCTRGRDITFKSGGGRNLRGDLGDLLLGRILHRNKSVTAGSYMK